MLAYNMKRMINIFGVNPLMQAIAASPRAPASASHRCRAPPASEIMFSHDLGRFDPFAKFSTNGRYLREADTVVAKHSYGRRSGSVCSTRSTASSTISPTLTTRQPSRRGTTKIISQKIPRKPLIRLDSDERKSKEIQGNPTLIIGSFRSETATGQENPNRGVGPAP